MERLISFVGLWVMISIAVALSTDRKRIDWRLVFSGVGLQIAFGMLVLWTEPGRIAFDWARTVIGQIISFSDAGAEMVFGKDFREHFFAFSVLSTIVFFSSLMGVLFHLGLIQKLVEFFAWIMLKTMRISGAESLSAAANIFVGQTEAPLVVKPYIGSMTRSEVMAMMTGGMATVSGGVMAAFVGFGVDAGHLLAASVMSAPASLVLAKIMVPETEKSKTFGSVKIHVEKTGENVIDAACRSASDGLKLALNVAAMLVSFIAFAALLNWLLSVFPPIAGEPLTFERIMSWIFAPLAFFTGVPLEEVSTVGMLLGKKTFLNEFIAYLDLKDLKGTLSERAFTISTYALCGFANFSSVAIQIGGIGALVPERRKDLAKNGMRSLIGGTLAALMTACVAGMLL